ncbi:interferon-related developmental regulator 2-like [Xenia sp. Carnegie-2017]|uniref:interferon-related developmental regulator 2-like n=1 Tax=Xenia sp. Carnegie-2017 TaxID=2897299 RepID=UPI001F03543E|nr:interferon-related developmental regulator 2-like [Xenia sp. Carnegie-2017]
MPKGRKRGTKNKGKGVEEGFDDHHETHSVASSQETLETLSNHTDDLESTDGTDVEEVETNFESILEENIENATDKNAKLRQASMKAMRGTFASHRIFDLVAERKDTILDIIEKSLKRGQAEDQVCAGPLAVLLCIQLGYGSESKQIFQSLKSLLLATLQDPTAKVSARTSCANALALCCFLASEEHEDIVNCLNALQKVFSSAHSAALSTLFCECLFSWALLLSVAPESLVEECVKKQCRRILKLMNSDDVNLRIAAGEVFALICEVGREKIEDFEPQQFGSLDILKDLATDGTKHRAKKDRRQQRSTFRDILGTIEDGVVPEEIVKFGNETMNLVTWTQRRQYAAFKDLLGPGINLHLKENLLLRDVFDLGPVQLDTKAVEKPSKDQRKTFNNRASKARTLSRAKHRDKRSFVH